MERLRLPAPADYTARKHILKTAFKPPRLPWHALSHTISLPLPRSLSVSLALSFSLVYSLSEVSLSVLWPSSFLNSADGAFRPCVLVCVCVWNWLLRNSLCGRKVQWWCHTGLYWRRGRSRAAVQEWGTFPWEQLIQDQFWHWCGLDLFQSTSVYTVRPVPCLTDDSIYSDSDL